MKLFNYNTWLSTAMLLAALALLPSCDKEDDFTIENKQVTGMMNYTRTSFTPLTFDSTGLNPLSARISMDGIGTLSDLGELQMVTTFEFDFIMGQGSNFVTTYSGTNAADKFTVNGTSQVQQDGTIHVDENIISGTGKFSKISGGGLTIVLLNTEQTAGTGDIDWVVTY